MDRSTPWAGVLAPILAAALLPLVAEAQTATTRVEENFRMEPNGVVLGSISPGTPLGVVQERGGWVEAELEGWMWIRSLQVSGVADFDLVISQDGGENLRATPSGSVLARLEEGTLLGEVERMPGWIRVRRRGWIWSRSVEVTEAVAPEQADPATEADPGGGTPGAGAAVVGVLAAGPEGAAVLAAPDGDTLARAVPDADLELLGREGSWARVRIEGWVWSPATGGPVTAVDARVDAGPSEVVESPDRYRGRVVTWDLQFISLERAESIRTDFFEGEPFLLTRFGDGNGPFVYVALPPDRVAELQGLAPLERIAVTGRVRTGASALTGTPIVDMLSWERARGSG